ncbi:MAG: sensor histidine kinase [Alphaproteobacteria bacterium]|nr:MAG: sensor histidine kinase [Alphaproteobacteria bacterium]
MMLRAWQGSQEKAPPSRMAHDGAGLQRSRPCRSLGRGSSGLSLSVLLMGLLLLHPARMAVRAGHLRPAEEIREQNSPMPLLTHSDGSSTSSGQEDAAETGRGAAVAAGEPLDGDADRARSLGERLLAQGILWDDRELSRLRDSLSHLSGRARLARRYQILRRLIWLGRPQELEKEVARLEAESAVADADDWHDIARLVRAWLPAMHGRHEETVAVFAAFATAYAVRPAAAHVQARMEAMIARLEADLGRPERAMAAMAAAYRYLDDVEGERHRPLARELAMQFGAISARYLDIESMVRAYREALALSLPGDLSPNVAQAVHALGEVLARHHHHATANRLFEGLRDLGRRRAAPKAIFLGEFGLMKVAHNQERFAESDAHARAALAAGTPSVFNRAVIAQYMALNSLGRGDISAARRHFETAHTALTMLPEGMDAETASYDPLIEAEILARQGREEEALSAMRRHVRMRLRAVHHLYRRESAFLLSRLEGELDAARLRSSEIIAETSRKRLILHQQSTGMFAAGILAFALLAAFFWQRRIAGRLRAARRAADAANRAKSEFLANISHELRTPLNAIIGFSEMMEREMLGKLGDARYRDYAAAVHRSGSHLLAVIDDIIDLSRIEAGEFRLEEEVGEIRPDIEAARELVSQDMERQEQHLVLDIPHDFPRLLADHRLLRQIFLNLLSNAVKFSPPGAQIIVRARVDQSDGPGGRRDVGRAAEGARGRLRFVVQDDGPGLSEEERRIALEPYGQVSATTGHEGRGSGLGLSLVQRFVALHGGGFALDSMPGHGTKAHFWLPGWRAVQNAPRED